VSKVLSAERYEILHHQVGPWPRGHVLTHKELQGFSEGVDVERLLALEAIEPTDKELTGPAPLGPENTGGVLVDSTGRVVDSPGNDRPDIAGRIMPKARTEMQQKTAKAAGVGKVAVRKVSKSKAAEGEDEPEAEEAPDYESRKVDDLREEATGRNIDGADTMKKADLIEALEADDKNRGASDA
jgi:hypothetical protein